ncbi:MAG: Ni/Fe hydrogenase subunit alpha [Candidatus Hydrothermarchaeales archaeon]
MSKEINIAPISRIEGHAKVKILLDEEGNFADAKFHTVEMRGFEKFCIGRRVEERPWITPRICGVCPWAHHLAAAKAVDACFGVKIPPTAEKLRRLAYLGDKVMDFILHFYMLSGPDFVMGPDADYTRRSVFGIVKEHPELGKKVIHHHHLAHRMVEIIAGPRRIHPVAAVAGGFSKSLSDNDVAKLKPMADELLEFAKFTIDNAKKNIFPQYMDAIKSLGVVETGFLAQVGKDGELDHYDGNLRLMDPDGSYVDFPPEKYTDYIAEHIEPWTYMKFPYKKSAGSLNLDPDNPTGIYRVNTLARINCVDKISTPLAQAELEEFREAFGRPAQQTLLYHYARAIEILYCAEHFKEILEDPDITNTDIKADVIPAARRGVGVVEASRGTLIHDYTTDDNGILTDVNLIVATTHNNAAFNITVKKAANDLIKGGEVDQGLLNKVEMTLRAYDPCLSCATHDLTGRTPVKVEVVDHHGNLVKTLANF